MIKRLLALWIVSALLMPSGFAFRDISPNSTLAPAIQHLVKKGALKDDGRFFRPDSHVPKGMFWETVILNTGFNASSATFDTALPPNIEEDHPLAQILREAIRRGFLSDKTAFDENEHLTRIQAIKHLLAVYGIAEPTRVSPDFRVQVSGISKKSNALPFAEAALASASGPGRPALCGGSDRAKLRF